MDDDPPGFDIVRTAFAGPGPDGKPWYADPRIEQEIIRRTALTLQPEGWVKAHTCSDRYDRHAKMEDRACDWVEGIRRYYEATHDADAVRELWPAVVAQMNYFLERRTSRGLVLAREWEVWSNPLAYVFTEGAGLNAFVYRALADAAYLGNEIGEKEQAAKFDTASEDLAAAFNKVLWDEKDGTYYSAYFDPAESLAASARDGVDTIKAAVPHLPVEGNLIAPSGFFAIFALDQGIVPAGRRDRVKQYMLSHPFPTRDVMLSYYQDKLLYASDSETLDKQVLDDFRTNWQKMASAPRVCSWEDLDGRGSHAHIYGMHPGYFLSAYVLGVRRDEPVWKKTWPSPKEKSSPSSALSPFPGKKIPPASHSPSTSPPA
jgi:alpha-L-rhamnosidase